jgi:hypothetical protein
MNTTGVVALLKELTKLHIERKLMRKLLKDAGCYRMGLVESVRAMLTQHEALERRMRAIEHELLSRDNNAKPKEPVPPVVSAKSAVKAVKAN